LQGIFRDITERKQMEQAKKTLVIDVSHSLKTPLAMIEMALNMSKEGIRLNDPKRIEKGQVIAYENIARSRKYISRMLEAFTVDLREKNLEKLKKRVSLNKIVCHIFKEIKLVAQERGLKLRLDIPVTANMVKAGERELSVILENLIDNALKFTLKGGISITSRRKKEWIEVRVKDTGCGIDPHNKVKLFEMFSKCYTVVEGLGLGLFICKRLTNLLGGEIQINSMGLFKGTEVILRLPC
jgi:two-component system phosphate regulon sensor histidine kinase PhoR